MNERDRKDSTSPPAAAGGSTASEPSEADPRPRQAHTALARLVDQLDEGGEASAKLTITRTRYPSDPKAHDPLEYRASRTNVIWQPTLARLTKLASKRAKVSRNQWIISQIVQGLANEGFIDPNMATELARAHPRGRRTNAA